MRTILVTGSDTGIGKSRVAAAIGRLLWKPNLRVQFVKPVETGRLPAESGDAEEAARASGVEGAAAFTLVRLRLPLAPLAGAHTDGPRISLPLLLEKWRALPPADLRIVEGAGGIAVPLDADGSDWRDFARAIEADRMVLVVADRLGAINQARLVNSYSQSTDISSGLWLNETESQPEEIRQSNREGLSDLPIWATQRFGEILPEDPSLTQCHLTE